MSDDLISRKAAVELVNAEYDRFQANGGSHSGRYELDKVIKMLQNMPTAFDKEKVTEELRKYTAEECELHECGIRSEYCNVCMAKKAIEIIEKGGIE